MDRLYAHMMIVKAPKLLKKKMPNVSGTHTVSGIASSLSFTVGFYSRVLFEFR